MHVATGIVVLRPSPITSLSDALKVSIYLFHGEGFLPRSTRLSRLPDLTEIERGRLFSSLLDLAPACRNLYFLPTFSDTTVAAALKQKFLSAAGIFSFLLEKFLLFLAASMML